jgi:hypothetical protein|tara:strand:+ start:395 stop:1102 length:708 start_codon:yes stop_codon:yes gene_type:complete
MITSGCSFTESIRPNQEKSWADYLAEKLGKKLTNYGKGGAGNEYIYNSVVDNLDTDLVVVMWSCFDRWDFHKGSFELPYLIEDGGTVPRKDELVNTSTGEFENTYLADENIVELSKVMLKNNLDDREYQIKKTLRWMVSLQHICEQKNISLIQCLGFGKGRWDRDIELAKTSVDYKPFYELEHKSLGWPFVNRIGGFTIMDKLHKDMFVSNFDRHPNDKGHKYISEIIYDEYKMQ